MEEGGGLLQLVWAVFLAEIVRSVGSATIVEERAENTRTLLNLFSRNGVEVLPDPVKRRLQVQGCTPSFLSFHLFVSKRKAVPGG